MNEDSAFATLPEGRRNWAVASIYGDRERLAQVHNLLRSRISPEDNIVYLGNMFGRGDVFATVEELLRFRRELMACQLRDDCGAIVYLRGAQEEMWHKLLQVQFAPNPRDVLEWMFAQGVDATLAAYGGDIADGRTAAKLGSVALSRWTNRLRATLRQHDGHDRLMTVLRRAAVSRDGKLLFVSAGVDPTRPLHQQSDAFWWGSRRLESLSGPYNGFVRIVRGVDAQRRGVTIGNPLVSLDGGCGFGGPLVAACFTPDGKVGEVLEA